MGVLDAGLLLQQVGLGVEERGRRRHGGEHGDGLTEFVVQSAQRVDDERLVGDGGATVVERVGEPLETAAVLANGQIALEQAMKLLLKVYRLLKTVVEELPGDGCPGGEGGVVRPVDVIPDLLGHRGVEPRHDASIDLEPLGIIEHGGGVHRGVDVIQQPELLDSKFDERSPLTEVVISSGKSHWDMVVNVEENECAGRGWDRLVGPSKGVGGVGSMRAVHDRRLGR